MDAKPTCAILVMVGLPASGKTSVVETIDLNASVKPVQGICGFTVHVVSVDDLLHKLESAETSGCQPTQQATQHQVHTTKQVNSDYESLHTVDDARHGQHVAEFDPGMWKVGSSLSCACTMQPSPQQHSQLCVMVHV
jgi:hypothetical protein